MKLTKAKTVTSIFKKAIAEVEQVKTKQAAEAKAQEEAQKKAEQSFKEAQAKRKAKQKAAEAEVAQANIAMENFAKLFGLSSKGE